MVYLGLTGDEMVPDGYDEYIFVSSRCIKGIDWCRKFNKKYSVLTYNLESDDISGMITFLKKEKNIVLDRIVSELNDFIKNDFDNEEWNLLLGQWLNYYIESLYEAYLQLKSIELIGNVVECRLYETQGITTILDYAEYLDLITCSGDFRKYIFSQVHDTCKPIHNIKVIARDKYFKPNIVPQKSFMHKSKIVLYRKIVYLLKRITKRKDRVVFNYCYFPQDFLFKMMIKSRGFVTHYITNWYKIERPSINNIMNIEWRNTNGEYEYSEEIENILYRLYKKFIPITYVEGFNDLKENAEVEYRYAMDANAIFYSCVEGHVDDVFKIYLMEMKSKGTQLCDVQHGGNYGIDKLWSSDDEYANCDIFYTWGWEPKNRRYKCTFKPMPAAKLMNRKLHRVKSENKILYINYVYPKYPIDLSMRTLFNDISMEEEIKFFSELDSSIKNSMVIRLYPDDYGWGFKDKLESKCTDLQYDHYKNFYDSLNQAKLVVLSDWSTTIVEALSVNKPIFVLRNTDTEEYAKADMEDLINVGVVVTSWYALKVGLERIYRDIDGWWNEPERKKVVSRIRKKYAYLPQNAEKMWETEIMKYVNGGKTDVK